MADFLNMYGSVADFLNMVWIIGRLFEHGTRSLADFMKIVLILEFLLKMLIFLTKSAPVGL